MNRKSEEALAIKVLEGATLAAMRAHFEALQRAIEAEGYVILVTAVVDGEQPTYTIMRREDYLLPALVCESCGTRLRPDHKDGEHCPACAHVYYSV